MIFICKDAGSHEHKIVMKLEFYKQIFEKILKHQISGNSVQWEPSCSMRTDIQT